MVHEGLTKYKVVESWMLRLSAANRLDRSAKLPDAGYTVISR